MRVNHKNLLLVNSQQFILLHQHVHNFFRSGQISDRLSGFIHDIAGLYHQDNLRKNAHRVLTGLDIGAHLFHILLVLTLNRFNYSLVFVICNGTLDHILHVFLVVEKLGASDANDLIMAAIILNKLVQGLEPEERCLVVLSYLAVLHVFQERLQ